MKFQVNSLSHNFNYFNSKNIILYKYNNSFSEKKNFTNNLKNMIIHIFHIYPVILVSNYNPQLA